MERSTMGAQASTEQRGDQQQRAMQKMSSVMRLCRGGYLGSNITVEEQTKCSLDPRGMLPRFPLRCRIRRHGGFRERYFLLAIDSPHTAASYYPVAGQSRTRGSVGDSIPQSRVAGAGTGSDGYP